VHHEIPRIVVSYGVNDAAFETGTTRVGRADSVAAFRSMNIASGPTKLMFIGPPAVDEDAHNERISALSDAPKNEARSLGIPYLGYFEGTVAHAGECSFGVQRSRKSLSQSRTALRHPWETCPATPVIRSRERVRGCSLMIHDGRSRPVGPSIAIWFGHPRSTVEMGRTITSVVTASR